MSNSTGWIIFVLGIILVINFVICQIEIVTHMRNTLKWWDFVQPVVGLILIFMSFFI